MIDYDTLKTEKLMTHLEDLEQSLNIHHYIKKWDGVYRDKKYSIMEKNDGNRGCTWVF